MDDEARNEPSPGEVDDVFGVFFAFLTSFGLSPPKLLTDAFFLAVAEVLSLALTAVEGVEVAVFRWL